MTSKEFPSFLTSSQVEIISSIFADESRPRVTGTSSLGMSMATKHPNGNWIYPWSLMFSQPTAMQVPVGFMPLVAMGMGATRGV